MINDSESLLYTLILCCRAVIMVEMLSARLQDVYNKWESHAEPRIVHVDIVLQGCDNGRDVVCSATGCVQ